MCVAEESIAAAGRFAVAVIQKIEYVILLVAHVTLVSGLQLCCRPLAVQKLCRALA